MFRIYVKSRPTYYLFDHDFGGMLVAIYDMEMSALFSCDLVANQ